MKGGEGRDMYGFLFEGLGEAENVLERKGERK